ncbi:hypothetical protein M5X00_09875 [Paenibacillus alvei]|uniref:Uncharacterized protein n=1 Tax=Paenibacillus alvei TaxID=44250 RepID=A0AAP6ZXH9_PAEAL|nr:hypothetical protein [Paenibacillus alvei]MCY7487428.1 hypothetical protein [Paenibacillus alvei]MCY9540957.1 hypothetical protein [Paenibacillus alvei]MCY9580472.1 hypothetical protein [Paenibacillus alvei]MCY9583202.1 hypothetical protein [Paenibacillus alvei]MCY9703504.1 hypothetical protein [Paenibacillus alvei]
MVRLPRWLLLLMAVLVGIGIVSSFTRDPISILIPIAIIAIVFLVYRYGPKKNVKVKMSPRTEAKLKAARTPQAKKRLRPRSQAKLTVIEGSKAKNEKRQQSK